jgi:hypothetical protein
MHLVSQAEYAELGNRIRHPIQSRSPLVIVHSANMPERLFLKTLMEVWYNNNIIA